ncbi:hypothetical protein EYF80_030740 [Liparis tanakae]|uniref:Uncharacterized protein n=1 Tax=Liparis tanakae TaxID=230148 RepID=A0A4Z2H2A6_9TELE|nr:hypothetical protein EYF80_030740 [Liparis tanakae]
MFHRLKHSFFKQMKRSRRRSFISMLMRVSRSLRVRSLPISLPSSAHSPSVQMQYCSENP